jgi:hypothetical protein
VSNAPENTDLILVLLNEYTHKVKEQCDRLVSLRQQILRFIASVFLLVLFVYVIISEDNRNDK